MRDYDDEAAFVVPSGGAYENGLSKREYFIAQAMKGILANPNCDHHKLVPSMAIQVADNTLQEIAQS